MSSEAEQGEDIAAEYAQFQAAQEAAAAQIAAAAAGT